MEPFDENDLKDMWESELDETQSLKTLDESYVHDWFEENKFKDCKVILNDKLMSDALLNGTIPIKSEHSYSLNSEGEFLQQSPRISRKREVERKLEGPLKAVGPRAALHVPGYATDIKKELSSAIISKLMKTSPCGNQDSDGDSSKTSGETIDFPSKGPFEMANRSGVASFDMNLGQNQTHNTFNRLAKLVKTYNLHAFENEVDGYTDDNSNVLPAAEVQKHKRQLMLRKLFAANETRDAMFENDWSVSTASEDYEESVSSEFSSDVEIEDSATKVESITAMPASFTVTAESELQGMRIDETTKNSTNLSSTIMIETSLKSFDQKVRTKNPVKTVNKTSEAIVSDKVGQNRISESLRTKSLPNVSNTGQRKGQEMFDTKLSTMILSCGAHNKHDATQSIYSNVMPATISTKLPSSSSNSSIRQPINTPLISSQPKGSTGILMLTEEEKRTLIAEGYPVPQQLPLSKTEEKSLKKIRRKIKNKISAQESRRKKKEYMDQLERRVEILLNENNEYKKRIEVLENANNSLLDELRKQQH